jgi:O-antigen/teichoic acid export membrane protein
MDNNEAKSLSKKTIHGVFALISRSLILQVVNLVAFLIISSILSASELGVFIAVIAIQRIISFFTDFGLGAALVQSKEELKREDLVTTFTIQFLITFGILVFFLIFSSEIQSIFKLNQKGMNLLLVLVFTIFLSSFKMIPSVLLEREINFSRLLVPQIGESLVFNTLLIILVLNNFGITSYTVAFLVSSLIGIPLYYYVSPWRVGFGINRDSLTHLRFGIQFQAKNILATLKDDFLTVILTRFLPFYEIGYIGFAQRISFFSYRYIVDSVSKVTFSSYSRIQHREDYLKQAIERSLFFISAAVFPMIFGLIIIFPYLISYIPGWIKWAPAAISVVFFSLNALVSSVSSILVNVLDATGRVKYTLRLMVLWTILTWTLTPILIKLLGYNGVAIASFLVALTVFITIYLVKQIVDFKLIRSIYKPVIATFVMVVFTVLIAKILIFNLPTLIFVIILGGLVYSVIFYLLSGKEIIRDLKKLYI